MLTKKYTEKEMVNCVINNNKRKRCYYFMNNKLARIKKVDIEVNRMNINCQ